MEKEELIRKIWECYIEIQNSCGMITHDEAIEKASNIIDEYHRIKLEKLRKNP